MNDKIKVSASDLKAPKTAGAIDDNLAASVSQEAVAAEVAADPLDAIAGEGKSYNVYHCGPDNMHMHTADGQDIRFAQHRHVTDQPEVIAYLDAEVARRNPMVTVQEGHETMTSAELDPMAALKRKHVREFLLEQAAANAANPPRDLGGTAGGNANANALGIVGTDQLSVGADSNSGKK